MIDEENTFPKEYLNQVILQEREEIHVDLRLSSQGFQNTPVSYLKFLQRLQKKINIVL